MGSQGPPTAEDPPLPERIGPYVSLEKLGEGGMGAVYTAYHPDLDRKVALKLIHASQTDEQAQTRLLREAQAMARLDHPNVVAVHDFGRFEDQVYLAMDRVEGSTLKVWLAEKNRPWREIVRVFVLAGRGLAAAHAAGMVHRDFKPANVLVGDDGRVRVADFGLARAVGVLSEGGEPSSPTSPAGTDPTPKSPKTRKQVPVPQSTTSLEKSGLLASQLTLAGTVTGTPKYMSPEQFEGQSGDPRTDQFSFCVALYEALYGHTPFIGQAGTFQLRPPRKDRRVPRFLRRALLRGLETDPEDRFGSMDELLEEISKDPLRQALRVGAVLGAGGLLAATAWLGHLALRPAPFSGCEHLGSEWNGVWDTAARAALAGSFDKAQVAAEAEQATLADIDKYVEAWKSGHAQACAAAARATKSDDTVLTRMTCLERQRTETGALISALRDGDASLLKGARDIIGSLLPPSRCADPRLLAALPRPPADPKVQVEVEQIRIQLVTTRADARFHPQPALEKLRALRERATALHYRPLESEVLVALARTEEGAGDFPAAEAAYLDAANAAEAGGADLFAAEVASSMSTELSTRIGDVPRAIEWLKRGQARLERVGGDAYVEALLEDSAAAIASASGKKREALDHSRRAEALATAALGKDDRRVLNYAVAAAERTVGVLPPEEARTLLESTLRRLKDQHASLLIQWPVISALATVSTWTGQFAEAQRWIDVLAGINAEAGLSGGWRVGWLELTATLDQWQGRLADAAQRVKEAEALAHDDSATDLLTLEGEIREAQGAHADSEKLMKKTLAILAQGKVEDPSQIADPLRTLGEAETALGKVKDALPPLERLLGIVEAHEEYPGERGLAQLALARALSLSHSDPPRALSLATAAETELRSLPWFSAQAAETAALAQTLSRQGR